MMVIIHGGRGTGKTMVAQAIMKLHPDTHTVYEVTDWTVLRVSLQHSKDTNRVPIFVCSNNFFFTPADLCSHLGVPVIPTNLVQMIYTSRGAF